MSYGKHPNATETFRTSPKAKHKTRLNDGIVHPITVRRVSVATR